MSRTVIKKGSLDDSFPSFLSVEKSSKTFRVEKFGVSFLHSVTYQKPKDNGKWMRAYQLSPLSRLCTRVTRNYIKKGYARRPKSRAGLMPRAVKFLPSIAPLSVDLG